LVVLAGFYGVPALAGRISGDAVLAPLRQARCEPLQVFDRHDQPLRTLPAACGHRGRAAWIALQDVPTLLQQAVLQSEDHRFFEHSGVDPLAVGRALLDDLRAGRVVSGASTVTMQLVRMLDGQPPRTLRAKLREAWRALALEQRLDKRAILEAYLNHAYYGHGAYGIAAAAERYFGKAPEALSDAEALLLAVLPRAPSAYDPLTHLDAALARRAHVMDALVRSGALTIERRAQLERASLGVLANEVPADSAAGHFVDWVLAQLPAAERKRGGALRTTLDLGLQQKLERAVAEHVATLRAAGVEQAGVVVLDAQSSEVLALVGSTDYATTPLDIVTRRRNLGSVLKPFAYALAIEHGQSPESIARDVGEVAADLHDRDFVGREGGPMSYREALAGSYNLAALDVLDGVGVEALHARLKQAGVAEATLAPERYGPSLVLGAARVRLLDVAAGYGFLVREGRVRSANGVLSLARPGEQASALPAPEERSVFSPEVSWLVMDALSDPAARHRRFGVALPAEDLGRVVLKTGTAGGQADLSAVLASSQYIVAAWAGRFDGAPTHGLSGLWGAGPLAARALALALDDQAPRLPPRPEGLVLPDAEPRAPHARTQPTASLAAWAERSRALVSRTDYRRGMR